MASMQTDSTFRCRYFEKSVSLSTFFGPRSSLTKRLAGPDPGCLPPLVGPFFIGFVIRLSPRSLELLSILILGVDWIKVFSVGSFIVLMDGPIKRLKLLDFLA